MLKVLVVASYADSLINFRGEFLKSLLAQGIEVHVAAPRLELEVAKTLRQLGVIPHSIALQRDGLNPFTDLLTLISLARLVRNLGPSKVFAYTIKPVLYTGLVLYGFRKVEYFPMITGLGFAFSGAKSLSGSLVAVVARSLYWVSLKRARRVIFQNPDDRSDLFKEGLLSENAETGLVNGSGVDLAFFPQCPLPDGEPTFLLIARLLKEKGVREYVQVAQDLKQHFPKVQFILAGWLESGPDAIAANELDQWIDQGAIQYLGKLADVRPALAQASVYVLPSYREGTPRTVLEAMAVGRGIITSDAPGCRETVVDGVNGYLIPVKNIECLREKMLLFINSRKLVVTMGMQSRRIAEEKYNVHRVNQALMAHMEIKTSEKTS